MQLNNFIKCSEISDGQYTVSIDLRGFYNSDKLKGFKKKIKELSNDCDGDTSGIYKFDGNKLRYKSETLFPMEGCGNKPKVVVVFGNPAFHSVKNGMFFFSRDKHQRHGMWGKLSKANLIKPVCINDDDLFYARTHEAEERKKLILSAQASAEYCLGLTTFYSFPTPVKGKFRDVQGVEKLFNPILKKVIIPFEVERISEYPFTQDATLVFVQKSSYKAFKRQSGKNPLFWPIRGKDSSGAYLSHILKKKLGCETPIKL